MDYIVREKNWKLIASVITLVFLMALSIRVAAEKDSSKPQVKEISGMSIMGNDEAPKSLFILPWKTSEIGFESDLKNSLLDGSLRPLDKEVLNRELDYFEIRSSQ